MLSKQILVFEEDSSTWEYQRRRVTIKPNGDVVPCRLLVNTVIGNIKKESLATIWYSEEMQRYKQLKISNVVGCRNCPYLYICGTGCRVNSLFKYGNLLEKDDEACLCFEFFEDIKSLLESRGFRMHITGKKRIMRNRQESKIAIAETPYYIE
ncbi:MAG: SPASM domain-containing protein [Candidatus Jordarchaeaceae archaeon]